MIRESLGNPVDLTMTHLQNKLQRMLERRKRKSGDSTAPVSHLLRNRDAAQRLTQSMKLTPAQQERYRQALLAALARAERRKKTRRKQDFQVGSKVVLVRLGTSATIVDIDYINRLARVRLENGVTSDWLPYADMALDDSDQESADNAH